MKYLLISLCLLTSCTSLNKNKTQNLTLDMAVQLIPTQDNITSVRSLLGNPDQQLPLADLDGDLWVYNDKQDGHHRLSLVFDRKTNALQSVLWLVRDRDPEIHLEQSKKRFPHSNFRAQDAGWDNPHSAPDERFYVDDKSGVSITFRKARQEVQAIGWSNPDFDTNSEDRKPAVKYEL